MAPAGVQAFPSVGDSYSRDEFAALLSSLHPELNDEAVAQIAKRIDFLDGIDENNITVFSLRDRRASDDRVWRATLEALCERDPATQHCAMWDHHPIFRVESTLRALLYDPRPQDAVPLTTTEVIDELAFNASVLDISIRDRELEDIVTLLDDVDGTPDGNIDACWSNPTLDLQLEWWLARAFPHLQNQSLGQAVAVALDPDAEYNTAETCPAGPVFPMMLASTAQDTLVVSLQAVQGFAVTVQGALPPRPLQGLDEFGSLRGTLQIFLVEVQQWIETARNNSSVDRNTLGGWGRSIEQLRMAVRTESNRSVISGLGERLDQGLAYLVQTADFLRRLSTPARGVASSVGTAAAAGPISDTRLPAVARATGEGVRRVMSAPRHPVATGIAIVVGLLALIGAVSAFVFARDDK